MKRSLLFSLLPLCLLFVLPACDVGDDDDAADDDEVQKPYFPERCWLLIQGRRIVRQMADIVAISEPGVFLIDTSEGVGRVRIPTSVHPPLSVVMSQ